MKERIEKLMNESPEKVYQKMIEFLEFETGFEEEQLKTDFQYWEDYMETK